MRITRKLLWVFWIVCGPYAAHAQPASFNFHHLDTDAGLSNGVIRSIARDKYGYTWIGTVNGLNRFNGYDAREFRHDPRDPFSLPDNVIQGLLCDNKGNLWVSTPKGIYRYDYSNAHFILQPGSEWLRTSKMLQGGRDTVYLASTRGLVVFNTQTASFTRVAEDASGVSRILLDRPVNDFCLGGSGLIYIGADTGLIVYKTAPQRAERVAIRPLDNRGVSRIGADKTGNVWLSYGDSGDSLLRADKSLSVFTLYGKYLTAANTLQGNKITSIFTDNEERLWITTGRQGLCLYRPQSDDFLSFLHDPLQSTSISSNLTTVVFQDNDGFIWIGTEGYGVNYFHPDKTFFRTIQASYRQSPSLPDDWCRTVAEDKQGFLWLGTASGLARYDPLKDSYTVFQNTNSNKVLHFNSIRSLSCDGDAIWIGTGNGLNRYHTRTGKMDFFFDKDSVPVSFFWTILKDHANNTWFGCRNGLYRHDAGTGKIRGFSNDPLLAPYCKKNVLALYEDSRKRIWIGFYGNGGLLMYDPAGRRVQHWQQKEGDTTTLASNNISSIVEDKEGVIWLATADGLNACDEKTGRIKQYGHNDRVPTGIISSLLVDDRNRLWLAAGKGLYMLDAARKSVRSFDAGDGLPSADFNTQSAYRLRNGDFIYPTLNGFVQFNPLLYSKTADTFNVYVSSFKVFGRNLTDTTGFESVRSIRLQPEENFFSLEMTALNYVNARQSWYAYKLEPFDKDWIYTRDRLVNYTNVPGNDYIFHYKASADNNNWDVAEKTLLIHIGTVYYKTWWFRLLLLLLTVAVLYTLYRLRFRQKERLHILQTKAYWLEKEKTQVMYESLKQQLNPHFLFNSLTSLSSLITTNPPDAKRFLDKMSKIYRYILKNRDSEVVSLAEEIKLADTYTQLQQTRFKKGLLVNMVVGEEHLHRKIAPVTLQNLIENAIKHNIIDEETPLVINISVHDDYLVVQNNAQKKTFVETSNKQGLANMRSLYHYLSGKPVVITEDNHFFIVKIPLI